VDCWAERWYDQVFDRTAIAIPVTVIEGRSLRHHTNQDSCHDGMTAVQIGFEQARLKSATRLKLDILDIACHC